MRSTVLFVAVTVGTLALFALTDPVPQDPTYHAFADSRSMLGVANFLDVMSNIPFLLVGAWGLRVAGVTGNPVTAELRWAWTIFFAGIALTAIGSSWYHLAPSDATLVWDRLPMTIGFMSLVAIIIGEYANRHKARQLLPVLLIAGATSVLYWAWSESRGAGDLRPYAVVQFLPILVIPIVLVLRGAKSDLTNAFWLMIGTYVLAKILEHFDSLIFAATGFISGHSLKHLAAALAPLVLLQSIRRNARSPQSSV